MDKIKFEGLPKQNLIYLGICSSIVLAFCVFGLYGSHKALKEQDATIHRLEEKIKAQQLMQPLYVSLSTRLQKKEFESINTVSKTGLPLDQLDGIPTLFGDIGNKCQVATIQANPETKSINPDSNTLPIRLVIRGEFKNLRSFLIQILQLPYVEHVEELQILEVQGGKELKVKLWLAVEDGKHANGKT
jgi:hypothetical protein